MLEVFKDNKLYTMEFIVVFDNFEFLLFKNNVQIFNSGIEALKEAEKQKILGNCIEYSVFNKYFDSSSIKNKPKRPAEQQRKHYLAYKENHDMALINKESFKKHKVKIYKREENRRINLDNLYIRKLLREAGFNKEDITTELIEFKKQQIILKRLINEKLK